MQLTELTNDDIAAATQLRRRAQLDIKHLQNTGLQMNQVIMMFIPLRFITRIEVRQGDQVIWTMDGGVTLSENPRIAFDYRVNGAGASAGRGHAACGLGTEFPRSVRAAKSNVNIALRPQLARARPAKGVCTWRTKARTGADREGPLHCPSAAARTAPCWSSTIFRFGSPDNC